MLILTFAERQCCSWIKVSDPTNDNGHSRIWAEAGCYSGYTTGYDECNEYHVLSFSCLHFLYLEESSNASFGSCRIWGRTRETLPLGKQNLIGKKRYSSISMILNLTIYEYICRGYLTVLMPHFYQEIKKREEAVSRGGWHQMLFDFVFMKLSTIFNFFNVAQLVSLLMIETGLHFSPLFIMI